jgi:hypothetical protein
MVPEIWCLEEANQKLETADRYLCWAEIQQFLKLEMVAILDCVVVRARQEDRLSLMAEPAHQLVVLFR